MRSRRSPARNLGDRQRPDSRCRRTSPTRRRPCKRLSSDVRGTTALLGAVSAASKRQRGKKRGRSISARASPIVPRTRALRAACAAAAATHPDSALPCRPPRRESDVPQAPSHAFRTVRTRRRSRRRFLGGSTCLSANVGKIARNPAGEPDGGRRIGRPADAGRRERRTARRPSSPEPLRAGVRPSGPRQGRTGFPLPGASAPWPATAAVRTLPDPRAGRRRARRGIPPRGPCLLTRSDRRARWCPGLCSKSFFRASGADLPLRLGTFP
jgi:hypothetical protein